MQSLSLAEIDSSWHPLFIPYLNQINHFLEIAPVDTTPDRSDIFRVFQYPIEHYSVLILGQDPYPGIGVADGLAFSARNVKRIPATLKNIFSEYSSDLHFQAPECADLARWMDAGVLLLNRTLTTETGKSNVHRGKLWNSLTTEIAAELGRRETIAILWGKNAREVEHFFTHTIVSAHPSPLSAYRGFFGSRPFSRANQILISLGREPIDWTL